MDFLSWMICIVLCLQASFIGVFLIRCLKIYKRENINWELYRKKYERPLGMTEKWLLAGKGFYTPMINAFGITSGVPLAQSIINQTLKHLMNKYTLFRMCIKENEEAILYFYKMDMDILSNIKAETRNDTDWKTVTDENRESYIFDCENGPLWKCIFLPNATINNDLGKDLLQHNCVVVFIQHHVINDGIGSIEMIKTFMLILNQLLNEKKVCTPLSPPVLPMDYFLNQRYQMSAFKKCLILLGQTLFTFKCSTSFIDWILDKLIRTEMAEQIASGEYRSLHGEKTTRCCLQILGKRQTRKLIQACRDNSCTVQGVIQAASNMALLNLFHAHGMKRPKDMKNYVAIDMRKRVLEKSAGFQSGSYGFRINIVLDTEDGILQCDPERLWEYARQTTKIVHRKVNQGRLVPIAMDILSDFIERYFNRLMKLDMIEHQSLLLVSSLGKFTIPDSTTAHAKPIGFLFSPTASRCDLMFTTYAVTVNEQLSISHSYYPHTTSESMIKDYIRHFEDILEMLIKNCG